MICRFFDLCDDNSWSAFFDDHSDWLINQSGEEPDVGQSRAIELGKSWAYESSSQEATNRTFTFSKSNLVSAKQQAESEWQLSEDNESPWTMADRHNGPAIIDQISERN